MQSDAHKWLVIFAAARKSVTARNIDATGNR